MNALTSVRSIISCFEPRKKGVPSAKSLRKRKLTFRITYLFHINIVLDCTIKKTLPFYQRSHLEMLLKHS